MDDNNKKCPNCDFDTLPVVTVSTREWVVCPVCGSDLIGLTSNSDDETSDDNVERISINSSSTDGNRRDTGESETKDEMDTTEEETDTEDQSDVSVDVQDELQDIETNNFVDEEMERLKRSMDDEDEDGG